MSKIVHITRLTMQNFKALASIIRGEMMPYLCITYYGTPCIYIIFKKLLINNYFSGIVAAISVTINAVKVAIDVTETIKKTLKGL